MAVPESILNQEPNVREQIAPVSKTSLFFRLSPQYTKEEKKQWWEKKKGKYTIGLIRSKELDTHFTIVNESFDLSKKKKGPERLSTAAERKALRTQGFNVSENKAPKWMDRVPERDYVTEDFESMYLGWIEKDASIEKVKYDLVRSSMKQLFRFVFGNKPLHKVNDFHTRLVIGYTPLEPQDKLPCNDTLRKHFLASLRYRYETVRKEILSGIEAIQENSAYVNKKKDLLSGLLALIDMLEDMDSNCMNYGEDATMKAYPSVSETGIDVGIGTEGTTGFTDEEYSRLLRIFGKFVEDQKKDSPYYDYDQLRKNLQDEEKNPGDKSKELYDALVKFLKSLSTQEETEELKDLIISLSFLLTAAGNFHALDVRLHDILCEMKKCCKEGSEKEKLKGEKEKIEGELRTIREQVKAFQAKGPILPGSLEELLERLRKVLEGTAGPGETMETVLSGLKEKLDEAGRRAEISPEELETLRARIRDLETNIARERREKESALERERGTREAAEESDRVTREAAEKAREAAQGIIDAFQRVRAEAEEARRQLEEERAARVGNVAARGEAEAAAAAAAARLAAVEAAAAAVQAAAMGEIERLRAQIAAAENPEKARQQLAELQAQLDALGREREEERAASDAAAREREAEKASLQRQIEELGAGREAERIALEERLSVLEREREEERAAARERNDRKNAEKANLQRRIAALTGEKEAERAELEGRLAALTGEKEAERAELEGRLAALTGEKEAERRRLEGEIAVLQEQIAAGPAEREAAVEALRNELDERIEEMEREAREAAESLAEAQRATAERDAQIQSLSAELGAARAAVEGGAAQQERILELEEELARLRGQEEAARAERNAAREAKGVEAGKRAESEEALTAARAASEAARAHAEQLAAELALSRATVGDSLREALGKQAEKQAEIDSLKAQLDGKTGEAEAEKEALEDALRIRDAAIQLQLEENEEQLAALGKMTEEKAALVAENELLKAERDALRLQLERLQAAAAAAGEGEEEAGEEAGGAGAAGSRVRQPNFLTLSINMEILLWIQSQPEFPRIVDTGGLHPLSKYDLRGIQRKIQEIIPEFVPSRFHEKEDVKYATLLFDILRSLDEIEKRTGKSYYSFLQSIFWHPQDINVSSLFKKFYSYWGSPEAAAERFKPKIPKFRITLSETNEDESPESYSGGPAGALPPRPTTMGHLAGMGSSRFGTMDSGKPGVSKGKIGGGLRGGGRPSLTSPRKIPKSKFCETMITLLLLHAQQTNPASFNAQEFLDKAGATLDDLGQCPLVLHFLTKLIDASTNALTDTPTSDGYVYRRASTDADRPLMDELTKSFNSRFSTEEQEAFESMMPYVFHPSPPEEFQTVLGTSPYILNRSDKPLLHNATDEEEPLELEEEEEEAITKGGIPLGGLVFLYLTCLQENSGVHSKCLPQPVRTMERARTPKVRPPSKRRTAKDKDKAK